MKQPNMAYILNGGDTFSPPVEVRGKEDPAEVI